MTRKMEFSPKTYYTGLTEIYRLLLHLFFPSVCPVCGKLASTGCSECFSDQVVPLLSKCNKCGGIYPCKLHKNSFPVISGNLHENLARELVLKLKYGNSPQVGIAMGHALARKIIKKDAHIIVPVPLHKGSTRKYNQAYLIAKGLSKQWQIQIEDCLVWHGKITNQSSKMSIKERKALPDGIIRSRIKGKVKSAIIVDDVVTTGSTLNRSAEALKKSGVSVLAAITWTSAFPKQFNGE